MVGTRLTRDVRPETEDLTTQQQWHGERQMSHGWQAVPRIRPNCKRIGYSNPHAEAQGRGGLGRCR